MIKIPFVPTLFLISQSGHGASVIACNIANWFGCYLSCMINKYLFYKDPVMCSPFVYEMDSILDMKQFITLYKKWLRLQGIFHKIKKHGLYIKISVYRNSRTTKRSSRSLLAHKTRNLQHIVPNKLIDYDLTFYCMIMPINSSIAKCIHKSIAITLTR